MALWIQRSIGITRCFESTPYASLTHIVFPEPPGACCPIPGTNRGHVSPMEDRSRSKRGREAHGHDRFLQLTHPRGSPGEPI